MKKIYIASMVACSISMAWTPSAHSRKAVLTPTKASIIVSPTDASDVRMLIQFDLPSEMMNNNAIIDFATLHVQAQASDVPMAQIDILALTTDWKQAASVTWERPWKQPGGDVSADITPGIYSLKSSKSAKEAAIDVTELVRAWKAGTLPNNGMVTVISKDDLLIDRPRVVFQIDGIVLKILYSIEYK